MPTEETFILRMFKKNFIFLTKNFVMNISKIFSYFSGKIIGFFIMTNICGMNEYGFIQKNKKKKPNVEKLSTPYIICKRSYAHVCTCTCEYVYM